MELANTMRASEKNVSVLDDMSQYIYLWIGAPQDVRNIVSLEPASPAPPNPGRSKDKTSESSLNHRRPCHPLSLREEAPAFPGRRPPGDVGASPLTPERSPSVEGEPLYKGSYLVKHSHPGGSSDYPPMVPVLFAPPIVQWHSIKNRQLLVSVLGLSHDLLLLRLHTDPVGLALIPAIKRNTKMCCSCLQACIYYFLYN